MSNNTLIPKSKLPNLGTTIFTQMSALAQAHQAINLSQGFPDYDGPRYLQERLAYHVAQGANQYAPMTGVQALREAIADKTAALYGHQPDANSEITITADKTAGSLTTDVVNVNGSNLPSTGGMGTVLLYVAGIAVFVLAGATLVMALRRRNA